MAPSCVITSGLPTSPAWMISVQPAQRRERLRPQEPMRIRDDADNELALGHLRQPAGIWMRHGSEGSLRPGHGTDRGWQGTEVWGADIGQDNCAIIGPGRFPRRAQVFTLPPMGAMICGPGGPCCRQWPRWYEGRFDPPVAVTSSALCGATTTRGAPVDRPHGGPLARRVMPPLPAFEGEEGHRCDEFSAAVFEGAGHVSAATDRKAAPA